MKRWCNTVILLCNVVATYVCTTSCFKDNFKSKTMLLLGLRANRPSQAVFIYLSKQFLIRRFDAQQTDIDSGLSAVMCLVFECFQKPCKPGFFYSSIFDLLLHF